MAKIYNTIVNINFRQKKTNHKGLASFITAKYGGDEETWTLDLTIMSHAL